MVEIWFAILSVTLAGYAVLDGSNIGSGVVQFLVARSPAERRLVVSAIGPLWTWHEVWLVASGGILFVAFPTVLAVALPGFYLAVFTLLWCMVGRGLSLELGGHLDDPLWRRFWEVVFSVVSVLTAILLGAALGNLVRGVPLGASGKFSMPFFTDFKTQGQVGILDWYTMSAGVFTLICVAAHGASYLVFKTAGAVHDRSASLARKLWFSAFLLLPLITAETFSVRPELFTGMMDRPLAWLALTTALAGSIAVVLGQRGGKELQALLGGGGFIVGLLGAAAASTFPVMLRSTIDPAYSLTAQRGAVGGAGLALALWWWPVAMTLSIAYFVAVFRQFNGKVRMAPPPSP
ncbi:MAG: cytochrome d ubiquinol oxidase subunit II [Vicinamibacteria bacterium]|nr:cytochrome d ubiquinol oxidase subunit II [Vicinamibacteria bacterium]